MTYRSFLTPLLAFALALLLPACTSVCSNCYSPRLKVAESWSEMAAAVQLKESESSTDAHTLSQWWRHLNDPLLSELVDEALQANLDVLIARERLREIHGRYVGSRANLFPFLDASTSAAISNTPYSVSSERGYNLFRANLDANWELDLFGTTRCTIKAARADEAAALASLHDIQVSLAAEVALSYVTIRSLQIRFDIVHSNLSNQLATLKFTEWRYQTGLGNNLEVKQILSNVEQTRAQIPSTLSSL